MWFGVLERGSCAFWASKLVGKGEVGAVMSEYLRKRVCRRAQVGVNALVLRPSQASQVG